MIRSVVILLVIIVAVSIHSVSARGKSGKGSLSMDGSMRLLLLVNEFGDDSDNLHHRHGEHEKKPRSDIRRREAKAAKGSKDGSSMSMRLLLSEFGM